MGDIETWNERITWHNMTVALNEAQVGTGCSI